LIRAVKDAGRPKTLPRKCSCGLPVRSSYRRLAASGAGSSPLPIVCFNELRAVRGAGGIFPVSSAEKPGRKTRRRRFLANVEDRQKETPLEWMELEVSEADPESSSRISRLTRGCRAAPQRRAFHLPRNWRSPGAFRDGRESVLVRARLRTSRELEACPGRARQGAEVKQRNHERST